MSGPTDMSPTYALPEGQKEILSKILMLYNFGKGHVKIEKNVQAGVHCLIPDKFM